MVDAMSTLAGQYDPAVASVLGLDVPSPAATVGLLMAAASLPQRALTQSYAAPALLHETNTSTINARYLVSVFAPGAETVIARLTAPGAGNVQTQSVTFDAVSETAARYVGDAYPFDLNAATVGGSQHFGPFTIASPSRAAVTDRYEVEYCSGSILWALPVADIETL